ncbi:hypothetical protein, variant [Aphanomyces invadans]|uniref:Uncharacterized protein n=1 Tax=Aphanomyces invadans TaxID=157072 RepID=A0A024ULR7_9STRA|nr:hypothetical protein, variant [Aphanomyces invadans]ETW06792.1 hypothetical protein, variant [Aphanomyces invadans]|eukprot:XP_008864867.1 hypothetical protein, variant [Aphanomyces invadans]
MESTSPTSRTSSPIPEDTWLPSMLGSTVGARTSTCAKSRCLQTGRFHRTNHLSFPARSFSCEATRRVEAMPMSSSPRSILQVGHSSRPWTHIPTQRTSVTIRPGNGLVYSKRPIDPMCNLGHRSRSFHHYPRAGLVMLSNPTSPLPTPNAWSHAKLASGCSMK